MKAKNFLFTAVLTFGAILFATNVSGQSTNVTKGKGTATGGSTVGTVDLVLKLKDFQELTVNGGSSTVEFSFETKSDYNNPSSTVADAVAQLNVFSTKKFNIKVEATPFTLEGTEFPEVRDLFTVQATNIVTGTDAVPVTGEPVSLIAAGYLFKDLQSKTKDAAGYNINIKYTLKSGSALYDAIGYSTKAELGTSDVYTSIVTYTIIPG